MYGLFVVFLRDNLPYLIIFHLFFIKNDLYDILKDLNGHIEMT